MMLFVGKVEWSTWGSKLESIFDSVFSTVPKLMVRKKFISFEEILIGKFKEFECNNHGQYSNFCSSACRHWEEGAQAMAR